MTLETISQKVWPLYFENAFQRIRYPRECPEAIRWDFMAIDIGKDMSVSSSAVTGSSTSTGSGCWRHCLLAGADSESDEHSDVPTSQKALGCGARFSSDINESSMKSMSDSSCCTCESCGATSCKMGKESRSSGAESESISAGAKTAGIYLSGNAMAAMRALHMKANCQY